MLLIIGLDGADLEIIQPMLDAGKLPNLERIIQSGVYGKLHCPIPPLTLPSWASFMTGVNPGRHNIFDFIKYSNHSYHYTFTNSSDRKTPTLWQRLGEAGYRVAVLGFPGTYPPEKTNGIMIAGFDSPISSSIDHTFMYPKENYLSLKKELSQNPWVFNSFSEFGDKNSRNWYNNALKSLKESIIIKRKTILALLKKENFDCIAVHFNESDTVGHHFWHFHDKNSPRHQIEYEEEVYSNAVETIYQELDYTIGAIENELPHPHHILILSDHGMGGSSDKVVFLNEFLRKKGYLSYHRQPKKYSSFFQQQKKQILAKLAPEKIDFFLRNIGRNFASRCDAATRFADIDWLNTYAFSDELNYAPRIRLNRIGREPMGIVAPGKEYEILIKKLSKDLLSLADPVTKKPIIQKIHRAETLYDGPYCNNAADLILELNDDNGYTYNFLQSPRNFPRNFIDEENSHFCTLKNISSAGCKGNGMPGSHRRQGVFFAAGPDVKHENTQFSIDIIDLSAFVLWTHECKANWKMESVLPPFCEREKQKALNTDTYEKPQSKIGANNQNVENQKTKAGQYSEQEKQIIYKRLASLGYLE